MDPHIYISFFGCRDVTDSPLFGFSVNIELQNSIDDYSVNYVGVFRPLDMAAMATPLDVVDGLCVAGAPRDSCDIGGMGMVYPTTAHNQPVGMTCFTADPSRLNSSVPYPAPNVVTGPCFLSDPEDVVISVAGTPIALEDMQIAATYSGGTPPSTLVSGVLTGFISEADARTTILGDLPLIGGDTLYQHLAAGGASGSSCSSQDDRDMNGGTTGFWFFMNISATQVDWTGP
jgi:hypothetical protein